MYISQQQDYFHKSTSRSDCAVRNLQTPLVPTIQDVHAFLKQQLGIPQQQSTSIQDLTKENLEYIRMESERLNAEKVSFARTTSMFLFVQSVLASDAKDIVINNNGAPVAIHTGLRI